MCRVVMILLLGCLAVPMPAAAASRTLDLGFFDPVLAADQPGAYDRAQSVGAGTVRAMIFWGNVANRRPANPTDPADPAYNWRATDATVRAAAARGHRLLLNPTGVAPWARLSEPPPGVNGAVWNPDPVAYGQFAAAAARRYSGAFPDPERAGQTLPAVRYWQAWNEPNIYSNLLPQWTRERGRWRRYAPALYRRMLNGVYDGVKSVSRANVVVTAGLAPFGDLVPGRDKRIKPADFWREAFCLGGRCRERARFDVIAHHPYGVGTPRTSAIHRDNVTVPDVAKIKRLAAQAVRERRASPARSKPLWITEISWDSSPPDPDGVPARRHARYVAEAFYLLWRQGAGVITWFRVLDQAPTPSYAATNQSGMFLLDGTPKLSARAFRFPFVTERAPKGRLRVWTKAPRAGTVTIERKVAGGWRRVLRARVGSNRLLFRTVAFRRGTYRARLGSETSLSWSQR